MNPRGSRLEVVPVFFVPYIRRNDHQRQASYNRLCITQREDIPEKEMLRTISLRVGRWTRNSRCLHVNHGHPRRRRCLGAEGRFDTETGNNYPDSTHSSFLEPRRSRSFWTLSFSGAGHLMPYHLGVVKTLLSSDTIQSGNPFRLPIQFISGSSSGAIAATVATLLPHRLDEYTDRFLIDRGHAFRNLREMLAEETGPEHTSCDQDQAEASPHCTPLLSICTTRCADGRIQLFSFEVEDCQQDDHERLLKAIEASCRIPQSFHPLDMVLPNYDNLFQRLFLSSESASGGGRYTYPDAEGVEIDGTGFVDGGIAGPFPPTPRDSDPECTGRIVVSPISGEYFFSDQPSQDGKDLFSPPPLLHAIRPLDVSRKLPVVGSLTFSSQNCSAGASSHEIPGVAVRARPSIQNLRAMITALGVVPAAKPQQGEGKSGGVLRDWFERGREDAQELLGQLEPTQ